MKKQIAHIITTIFFIILFAYAFGEEYWGYQSERGQELKYKIESQKHAEEFSLENLHDMELSQLHMTPNLDLLEKLVGFIDAAQEYVYMEVYIFTEKDLRDAVIRAHKRGVSVRVLLENNPYKAPYLNDKHYQAFKDEGIDVRWSDPLNYSLNHSKLLIIDTRAFISTGNFSYSLFKYNRDFLIEIQDESIVADLIQLFLQDFHHQDIGILHPNIVLSPEYSRTKIETLIQSSKETIDIYFPYISDERFEEVLFNKAQQGISIRFIVEKDFYEENPEVIERFGSHGIEIFPIRHHKLHAKAILVDKKKLYIGSINFSTYSFDENRELGIITGQKEIIQDFQKAFISDL